MGKLADDAGKARLAEPFFHRQQHHFLGSGFEMDHAVRGEPGAGEAGSKERREKTMCAMAPEHRALKAREQAGGEQGGRAIRPLACDLVQGAECEAAARQMRINPGETESQHREAALCRPLEPKDAGPEMGEYVGRISAHVPILFSCAGAVKLRTRSLSAAVAPRGAY